MVYGRDTCQVALGILNDRRMRENKPTDERYRAFYAMYPRVHKIERQLAATAIGAAKAMLNDSDTVTELTRLREKNLSLQQGLNQILRQTGLEQDYLNPYYQYRKYGDTGYVDGKMCSCLRDLLHKTAYQRLGEMTPFSLCSFEEFSLEHYPGVPQNEGETALKKQVENTFHFYRTYARDFSLRSPGLILQGETGLGETHLSLAITCEAVGEGFGVTYLSTQNMAISLGRERFGRAEEDEDTNALLLGCDLLFPNDLGTEFFTSFIDAIVYNIVNIRLMAGRPTTTGTNLPLYELQKHYSKCLVSQIIGNYVCPTSLGKDVRQRKRMKYGQGTERWRFLAYKHTNFMVF